MASYKVHLEDSETAATVGAFGLGTLVAAGAGSTFLLERMGCFGRPGKISHVETEGGSQSCGAHGKSPPSLCHRRGAPRRAAPGFVEALPVAFVWARATVQVGSS